MINLDTDFGRVARTHLDEAYFVWIPTIDGKGVPPPRPVWFIWEKDSFLIFSQANAYKVKHIITHPGVSLHFNTIDNKGEQHMIVFTGTAIIDKNTEPANKNPAYFKKYETGFIELKMTPEEFSNDYSVAIRIRPENLRGWE